MKIQRKILIPMVSVSMVLLGIIGALALAVSVKIALAGAKNQVLATVERDSYQMEAHLENPFATIRTLGAIFEDYEALYSYTRREDLSHLLHSVLEKNDEYLALWTAWEPSSIDNLDVFFAGKKLGTESGAFAYEARRGAKGIEVASLSDGDRKEKRYADPFMRVSEVILGPYKPSYATELGDVFTIASAIVRDGKSIGVIGIDVGANLYRDLARDMSITEHSSIALLNNDYVYLFHPDSSMVGKSLLSLDKTRTEDAKAIRGGTRYAYDFKTQKGQSVYRLYTPVKVSSTGRPWSLLTETPNKELREVSGIDKRLSLLFAAFIGVLLIQTAVTYVVARSIAKPARLVDGMLKDIASGEGDLTKRLGIKATDEIGQFSRSFDLFAEGLASIIGSIKSAVSELKEGSMRLENSMDGSTQAAARIDEAIDVVVDRVVGQASSVEEVSATVEQMTRSIESLDRMIERQRERVEESSASIEEMVGNLQSIGKSVDASSTHMARLVESGDAGRKQLSIVADLIRGIYDRSAVLTEANKTIQTIASQTNLLAMNAAIEAAHAGDAGLGFAVVADEIRKLAELSTARSKEIAGNIGTIRDSIGRVVDSSTDAQASISDILDQVRHVGALEEEVKRAVQEQSSYSETVLGALSAIRDITDEVRGASSELTTGATEMGGEVRDLVHVAEDIQRSMEHIATESGSIKKATLQVSSLGERNAHLIASVEAGTDRFKV